MNAQVIITRQNRAHQRQQGLSLVELSVVTVVVLLIAVLAVPVIQGYLVENKVPKVGEALAHFVLRQHLNTTAHGQPQYQGMNTQHFAQQNKDSAVFSFADQGAQTVVHHGLGKNGELQIVERDGGESLELRLTNVHHAACPALATVMHRLANEISVGPQGQQVVVKDPALDYNAFFAQQQCADGEVNTFSFVIY